MIASWKESCDNPRQCIKKQRHHFANKSLYSQSYGLSISHVQLWELSHKEVRVLNNCYCWSVVLEKTLESPLDSKKIKPINSKGNQPWIFIGRTDAKAEAPILWPSDDESQFIGKDPDAWKEWRQKKREREDEMVGSNHWFNGHELGQTPEDTEGQEAWHAAVHGVTKSWTRLRDWTTTQLSIMHTHLSVCVIIYLFPLLYYKLHKARKWTCLPL